MIRSLTIFVFFCCFFGQTSRLNAQAGDSTITYSVIKLEPCRYRLFVNNQSLDCYNQATLLLQAGTYTSWIANSTDGWVVEQLSPTELLLTHTNGLFPVGATRAVDFYFFEPGGTDPILSPLYPNLCLMQSFSVDLQLEGCPGGCVSGTVYRECGQLPFMNQPEMEGWTVELYDANGNLHTSTSSGSDGSYLICDLAPGNYQVKAAGKPPKWTPKVPVSGQYAINVAAGGTVTRDFGFCPSCSCDSIDMAISQDSIQVDTASYSLTLSVLDESCFQQFTITIDTGQIIDFAADLPGWVIEKIGNTLLLTPPSYLNIKTCRPCHFRLAGVGNHGITVSTTYNIGMAPVECKRPYVFGNHFPIGCCPAGTSKGPELVQNGNFQGIYAGFTSDYFIFNYCSPEGYKVVTGAQVPSLCNNWACTDHTTGLPNGYVFVADGSQTLGKAAWREIITVSPNTQYAFCAYVNNLNTPDLDRADPDIQAWLVDANNIPTLLTSFAPSETPDQWIQITANWTSPAAIAGPYKLEIRTANTSFEGNNFALDDISFRSCTPLPCAVTISTNPSPFCGTGTLTANPTGQPPFSYQWCSGENTQSINWQDMPCGTECGVTVTCKDGSTATASFVASDVISPVAKCVPGFGVDLGANCQLALTAAMIDDGSTDNCQIQSMSVSPNVLTGCGDYQVTLTVEDWCGNTSTCTTGVQTIEVVPPVITNCPPGVISVNTLPGQCYGTFSYPLIATDNCDPNPTINCSMTDPQGNVTIITPQTQLPKGFYIIACEAVDACGNISAPCYVQLSVEDNEGPGITCPLSISVVGTLDPAGQCKAVVNGIAATVTDNCPNWTLAYTISPPASGGSASDASGTMFMQGLSTVTYTVTDCGENTKTCSFTIDVKCLMGPCIEDFETNSIGQWQVINGMLSVITDPITGSKVLKGDDDSGASWMYNEAPSYSGDWTQKFDNCFCFDIRYDSGNSPNPTTGTSAIAIYNSSPLTNIGRAIFVVNTPIGNAWTRVCAPVGLASGSVLPSNAYGTWTSATPSTFNSLITGVLGIGVILDFGGGPDPSEMIFLDNFCIEKCLDTCICGTFSDISYRPSQGAPNQMATCGDTLFAQCQGLIPWTMGGTFMCQGDACPPSIPMSWTLTKPGGSMTSGNMTGPNFNLSIPASDFSTAGLYQLTLKGICGNDTCYCYFTIDVKGCPCCHIDQADFEMNIQNAISYTIDNQLCKASVNIGNLPDCDKISNISWGDGTFSAGPYMGGDMPMHTYSSSGTYIISYLAQAWDFTVMPPKLCFETVLQDTITLVCDSCECKGFSELQWYNSNWTGVTVNTSCDQTLTLPCLRPGAMPMFFFHGNLSCNAADCLKDTVRWEIVQMPGSIPLASNVSGLWTINPVTGHFDINLNPAWFTAGVNYMLSVTGQCGSKTCTCKVNFSFKTCPCSCDSFEHDVTQGFKTTGKIPFINCKRTFMPIALCPDDQVMWSVNGGPTVATSTGNTSVMINFPGAGKYTVCMKVTRMENGVPCGTYTQCHIVKVQCGNDPSNPSPLSHCEKNTTGGSVIENGDFRDGKQGELVYAGQMPGWNVFPNTGEGIVMVDDSTGADEDGHIVLTGNKANFAGIWQQIDLPAGNFTVIEFQSRIYHMDTLPEGTEIEFRLQDEPILGSPSELLWKVPYDKKMWSCDWNRRDTSRAMVGVDKKYLVICLRNGDENVYSTIGIDNIEICSSPTVNTGQPDQLSNIRIFPNPNTGAFTVDLPQAAVTGMQFRIIDLAGRLVLEQKAQAGSNRQTVEAGHLPNGLYFLQVVAEGKIRAIEKFVKQ